MKSGSTWSKALILLCMYNPMFGLLVFFIKLVGVFNALQVLLIWTARTIFNLNVRINSKKNYFDVVYLDQEHYFNCKYDRIVGKPAYIIIYKR